ncbi:MAG: hypothetical protein HY014_12610 [Acidobacteria bacterium]|nr:hypothetical protein [Acidobacteriota bacterium]MBI3488995.1 hypothetical protein [Acidobacteriota bacterium]
MDALSVNPLALAAVNAASALRPLAVTAPATSTTLTAQDLAQSLFRQSLQAAAGFPLAEPTTGMLSLAPEATASLLASLNAPQAAASTTPQPPAVQATADTSSTAPSPNPPATIAGDALPGQDAFAASSSLDFAMEAALRFGSGVAGSSAPAPAAPTRGAELVRDAASVISTGGVQPHAGGPGPEAFLRAQANLARILRDYQAVSTPAQPQAAGVDLLA